MSRQDIERWEARYRHYTPGTPDPDPWLVRHARPLPPGTALDVACGLGQNAIWLASQGHRVIAVDGSYTALRHGYARARAEGLGTRVLFVQADLDRFSLLPATFDLIVVMRFLARPLVPMLIAALRPGGHLLYATYTLHRLQRHPHLNPDYLLAPGELRELFTDLNVLVYEEEGEWARLVARR